MKLVRPPPAGSTPAAAFDSHRFDCCDCLRGRARLQCSWVVAAVRASERALVCIVRFAVGAFIYGWLQLLGLQLPAGGVGVGMGLPSWLALVVLLLRAKGAFLHGWFQWSLRAAALRLWPVCWHV